MDNRYVIDTKESEAGLLCLVGSGPHDPIATWMHVHEVAPLARANPTMVDHRVDEVISRESRDAFESYVLFG